jgi:hypothetical protein
MNNVLSADYDAREYDVDGETIISNTSRLMALDNLSGAELIVDGPANYGINLLPFRRLQVTNDRLHPITVRSLDAPGRVRVSHLTERAQ